jgi:hypothetical protein
MLKTGAPTVLVAFGLLMLSACVHETGTTSSDGDRAKGPSRFPILFGASGPDAVEWAAIARQDEYVELVTRQRTNGQDSYTLVPEANIEAHVKSAEYVIVRRWLTPEEWKEFGLLATPVWPELAEHIARDAKAVSAGTPPSPPPPPEPPPGAVANPNSAVAQFNDGQAEELHRPRSAGGFGAMLCGFDHDGFVMPVVTPEINRVAEKAASGKALTPAENKQFQLYRIQEFVLRAK